MKSASVRDEQMKVAARLAALQAKAKMMDQKAQLEQEEFLLKQTKKHLELEMQLAKTEAVQRVYAQSILEEQ